MTAKKRPNPQDATLRNIRSLKRRVLILEANVKDLLIAMKLLVRLRGK